MIDITKKVIIGAVLILSVFDVIAYFNGGVNSTISLVILMWSKQYPIVPFLAGVLCGHLFAPITLVYRR